VINRILCTRGRGVLHFCLAQGQNHCIGKVSEDNDEHGRGDGEFNQRGAGFSIDAENKLTDRVPYSVTPIRKWGAHHIHSTNVPCPGIKICVTPVLKQLLA